MFKPEMLIYQSKANLDENILFGEIIHLEDPKNRKVSVRSLYGSREFHVPFESRIYLVLTFIFNTMVSFRNEF